MLLNNEQLAEDLDSLQGWKFDEYARVEYISMREIAEQSVALVMLLRDATKFKLFDKQYVLNGNILARTYDSLPPRKKIDKRPYTVTKINPLGGLHS